MYTVYILFIFVLIKLLLVGCDEVWHLGLCESCLSEDNKYQKYFLFLNHLNSVCQYIKTYYPSLKIIIWDDMIRSIPLNILNGEKSF